MMPKLEVCIREEFLKTCFENGPGAQELRIMFMKTNSLTLHAAMFLTLRKMLVLNRTHNKVMIELCLEQKMFVLRATKDARVMEI